MKNKKIFVGAIGVVIILCSLIFLFGSSSKDIEICQNLSWKDNSDKVEEKLSKLDLVSCEDSSKIEIDKRSLYKEPYFVHLQTMGVSSKSPSINLADVPLSEYYIMSRYDMDKEIVSVDEVFKTSWEYSNDESAFKDNKDIYNAIIKKVEDKNAEYVDNLVLNNVLNSDGSKHDVYVSIYKTRNNYITITKWQNIYNEEASAGIHYFNPRYTLEDVVDVYENNASSKVLNDAISE